MSQKKESLKYLVGKENFNYKNLMTITGYIEISKPKNSQSYLVTDLVYISFTPEYNYDKTFSMQLSSSDLWNLSTSLRNINNPPSYEKITGGAANMKKISLGLKGAQIYINGDHGITVAIGFPKHNIPGIVKQIENLANETTKLMYKYQRFYAKLEKREKESNENE